MADKKLKPWMGLGILTICLMLSWCCYGCGAPSTGTGIGALAPDFTLTTLNGDTVRLSQLRGQPVLLNFWATWCGPCRMEIPYLQAAFDEKGEEIQFIGINLGESEEKVRQFAYDYDMTFTIALDTSYETSQAYNIRYIPTTFLIDRQGVICDIKIGPFQSENELIVMLDSLLQK